MVNQTERLPTSPAEVPARPATRGLVPQVIERHFSTLHPIWIEQHLKLLCELRRVFGSDLDKPIILAVIGQRQFETASNPNFSYSDALGGELAADMSRLTNVESVTAATAIPRETVRRKVGELIAMGWVEKGPRGALLVTSAATRGLAAATSMTNSLLDVTFEALAGALVADGQLEITPLAPE